MTVRNIGIVTSHAYPTAQEVRVERLSRTLCSRGDAVSVLCPLGEFKDSNDADEFSKIVRFKPHFNLKVVKMICAPLPINPIWIFWLYHKFKKLRFNIVIVRDLRLGLPTVIATRLLNVPVILDIGEHYPGMMDILGKQNLVHYITRNHYLISILEKLTVKLSDHVWVVVEENKKRLSSYNSRISIIGNFPNDSTGKLNEKCKIRKYSQDGSPIRIISFGLIDNIRGLDLAIDAFKLVLERLENCKLIIYGDGYYRNNLEQRVNDLELNDKVEFAGWVVPENKYSVLADGDIGLILHKECDLTQFTMPNKLFDYMKVGLPIISTNLMPVENVLMRVKCGISVSESKRSVADELIKIILNVDLRRQFSENAIKCLESQYRWRDEEIKILEDVLNLTEKDPSHDL